MESRTTFKMLAIAVAICLSIGTTAWGQNPTGTLTGRVTNNEDGTPLPGVTVTATSPNKQGERVTITGANGDYKLPLLPAGPYTVKYELDGMATRDVETKVSAAQTVQIDVGHGGRFHFRGDPGHGGRGRDHLRDLHRAVDVHRGRGRQARHRPRRPQHRLARGGHQQHRSVNSRGAATVISGAMSFESLWMVNGVVVNENLRGQPLDLFIEDAIEETTVTTAGISAEYGRFTGGVVNVLTKSGGNDFHGSLRASLTNQDWTSTTSRTSSTPDSSPRTRSTRPTRGPSAAPIWKDRIWFFLAGRDLEQKPRADRPDLHLVPADGEQERYEGKLDRSHREPHPHRLLFEIDRSPPTTSSPPSARPRRAHRPWRPAGAHLGELQRRDHLELLRRGAVLGARVAGVRGRRRPARPLRRQHLGEIIDSAGWHAPDFCGVCEGEERSNENALVKGSYFLSTESIGSHDFSFGYDTFEDIRFSVNHQSGSDFRLAAEDYFFDAQNNVYPVLRRHRRGERRRAWVSVWPVFGLDRVAPTDFNTNSYYINDRWQLNDHWSFNLGVRYDENDGKNAGGAKVADDSKISPRLAASYDLKGDGDLVFNATYGTYVAAIQNNLADSTSNGGALGRAILFYRGAPINPNGDACLATNTCISTDQATHMAIDWWLGVTGFNPITDPPEDIAPIPDDVVGSIIFPSTETNRIIPDTIVSPSRR